MFYKFLIFSIIIFIISLSTIVEADNSVSNSYSISLEIKVNLPSEEGKFMDILSLLERRMSETGTITHLSRDKNRVDFIFNTKLTSDRVKYVLSKSGMFSVKDQSGNKNDLRVKYAYCGSKPDPNRFPRQLYITLSNDSGEAFAKMTEENIGKKLSCFLDGEFLSEHKLREKITDGRIVVSYCSKPGYYAEDLAVILNNGPLTADVSIITCEKI